MKGKVLVLGYYHKNNLGDEMFKETIPLLLPNYELEFMSTDSIKPDDNFDYNQYKAIVCGGGDIISDYFNRKIRIAFDKYDGLKIALGVGIPFPNLIEKGYLDIFDHVFIREKTDLRRIQKRLGSKYVHFLPDLGFLLRRPKIETYKKKHVGICLIQSIFHRKDIVNNLIEFFKLLLEDGYHLTLFRFNTSGKQSEDDKFINKYVYDSLSDQYDSIYNDETKYNTKEMLRNLRAMDYNICMRFHSNVFSSVVNTPFLSIFPTRKVELLVKDMELEDHAYKMPRENGKLIELDTNELHNKFKDLVVNHMNVKQKLKSTRFMYRHMLKTKQPQAVVMSGRKRVQASDVIEYPVDRIYENIRGHLIETTQFDPESDDRSLAKNINRKKATQTAKLMSLSITGAPADKYTYGTIENLMNKPWELKGMIDWILKDFNKDKENSGPRLNMNFINQENLKGVHRSGWQFCVEYLKSLQSDTGVLFDLYIDRTFHWASDVMQDQGIIPYTSPWIGVVHHAMDEEFSEHNVNEMIANPLFLKSLPTCKGLITLSKYLRDYLVSKLGTDIPIIALYHPTQFVPHDQCFTMQNLIDNDNRKLINIGGWYRNTASIYHLEVDRIKKSHRRFTCPPCISRSQNDNYPLQKAILKGKDMDSYFPPNDFDICGGYNEKNKKHFLRFVVDPEIHKCPLISGEFTSNDNKWVFYMEKYINENDLLIHKLGIKKDRIPNKFHFNINDNNLPLNSYESLLRAYLINMAKSVRILEHLPNDEYDRLLSENIIFLNLVDCSAANTVIECIVRNTPLVVNRHPAVVEYIGKDYPLYYDSLDQVPKLLEYDKVKLAHRYLKQKDKEFLHIDYFIESLKDSNMYQSLNA